MHNPKWQPTLFRQKVVTSCNLLHEHLVHAHEIWRNRKWVCTKSFDILNRVFNIKLFYSTWHVTVRMIVVMFGRKWPPTIVATYWDSSNVDCTWMSLCVPSTFTLNAQFSHTMTLDGMKVYYMQLCVRIWILFIFLQK